MTETETHQGSRLKGHSASTLASSAVGLARAAKEDRDRVRNKSAKTFMPKKKINLMM
jgi:hypothetical protein